MLFSALETLGKSRQRFLEEREQERVAKLEPLRRGIQKGLDGGPTAPLDMEALLLECHEQFVSSRDR